MYSTMLNFRLAVPLTVKDKHDGTYRIVLNDPTSGDFVLDLGFGDPTSVHPSTVLDRSSELPVLVSIDLGDSDALGGMRFEFAYCVSH
jgi:hypothetical protein